MDAFAIIVWGPLILFCLWQLADTLVKVPLVFQVALRGPQEVAMPPIPLPRLTRVDVERLTVKHIKRYTNMLQSNSPFVSKEDAEHYLKIWQRIADKGYEPDRLAPFEKGEVFVALIDETDAKAIKGPLD